MSPAKILRGQYLRPSDPEVKRRNKRLKNAQGTGDANPKAQKTNDYKVRQIRKLTTRALSAMWTGVPCCMMKNGGCAKVEVSWSISGYGEAEEDCCDKCLASFREWIRLLLHNFKPSTIREMSTKFRLLPVVGWHLIENPILTLIVFSSDI